MQGPIVQIGPQEYSINDPEAINQIYRGPGGGFQKLSRPQRDRS